MPEDRQSKPIYMQWLFWVIIGALFIAFVVISVFAEMEKSDTPTQTSDPSPSLTWTESQSQAVEKAESYLKEAIYSRQGLISKLIYEGFSEEDSTFGADNVGADWFEQAAKKAELYMRLSKFSPLGLYNQLITEGFTEEEAEFGVHSVGL